MGWALRETTLVPVSGSFCHRSSVSSAESGMQVTCTHVIHSDSIVQSYGFATSGRKQTSSKSPYRTFEDCVETSLIVYYSEVVKKVRNFVFMSEN